MNREKDRRGKNEIPAVVPSAGMRRDATRRDTNAAVPDQASLIEEMEWRKEHQQ